ncbi:MAG: acetylornithine transaminase [Clostridia bacterium]|nr:acetylornithine transaminase [Clostridia bacterium]
MTVKEKDLKYIAGTYNRFPVVLTHGKGSAVFDESGKEYIDMGSGIAVTSFGIADSEWQKAVCEQSAKLQHTSNLYYTEPCVALAELLCKKTGMSKVFFSNSGAEANECAIKVARKYSAEKKGNDCYTIVTLKNSFHGRTLTTLSATGQEHYHELYQPLTGGFVSIDVDFDEFIKVASEAKIAGVMFECIQGEGGVKNIDKTFLKQITDYAHENDIPVIVDEVQTGNGRTGKLYCYMNYEITPDIISTAKGLAGGLPLGATMLSDKVKDVLSFGDHGSTFGANPVCCAAAISILNRIDEDLLVNIREKSKYIFDEFSNAKGIEDISGIGLMIGLKTKKDAAQVVKECMEKGVLCLTAKDRVRLLPALNIPFDKLKTAVEIIKSVL